MMKRISLLMLPLVGTLAAQSQPPPRPLPPPRPVVVFHVPAKAEKEQSIELAEVAVCTRLVGALAETTVTLVLRNPNSRAMEGELSFPLPPDATLQGYALDVNGKMVDGVPVPKKKARIAFEEEQRKGVDPGLVEWSGGNAFKTRVSPIPAHGQRTVRLRYTSVVDGNNYRLPLNLGKVGAFRLRIEAATQQQPQVQSSSLANLSFAPWQNQFVLEREWKELDLAEDLVVALPDGMATAPAVEKHGDKYYFARVLPLNGQIFTSLPTPDSLQLVWDASGSMERVDKAPIRAFLKHYFATRPEPQKPCKVFLSVVRDTYEPTREFIVQNGDVTELFAALDAIRYDGATSKWVFEKDPTVPLTLWVTDGNVNFAAAPQDEASRGTALPVSRESISASTFALVAGSQVDKSALRRHAATLIDLLGRTPEEAVKAVPAWHLMEIKLDGKQWDGALCNSADGTVEGPVLITGELPEGKHEVTLVFRANGMGTLMNLAFDVDTATAVQGGLNRSFHAQNKLIGLLAEPAGTARDEKLRQLGEEYGIVTPGTSLLVLENLEQYLEHEVRPPACCPELRQQYDARSAARAAENARKRDRELVGQKERARSERTRLQSWYEDYKSEAPPQRKDARRYALGEVQTMELTSRAWAPVAAPSVVVSTGAAPAPMATVEEDACEAEAGAGVDVGMGFGAGLGAGGSGYGAAANGAAAPAASPTIRVKAWSSEAPYLAALKSAADPEAQYMELRREYGASPGFFLDCADWFEQAGKRPMAVRVLSNLIEMELENRSLLRAAAYKLRYMGELEKAIMLFGKVRELFPEEPQSYRDLALALADAGRWQEAVDTLRLVLEKPMDERFRGTEQIAAVELAHIVARAQKAGKPVSTEGIDAVYLKPLETDLRVVINWDTDMSDMDLWVTDAQGEKCFYSHNRTSTGGRISRDVTQGYGPEEFLIRKALPGNYKVQAHYYGSGSPRMLAPVTLYAEVYTDYGRETEQRRTLVFRLAERDRIVDIGTVAHAQDPKAPQTRDYQVRAGESWEAIAAKELGNSARAAEIIALNPGASADVPPATGSIIRLPRE